MKQKLLYMLCCLSGYLGIFTKFFFRKKTRVSVLMYHGITSEENQHTKKKIRNVLGCNISQSVFEKQMQYLSKHCHVVSLPDVLDGRNLKEGVYNVIISFDDGYRNNYTKAFPILKKYKFPALFALTTGFIMDRQPLNIDMLEWLINQTKRETCSVEFNNQSYEFKIASRDEKIEFYKWTVNHIVDGQQKYREQFIASIAEALEVDVDNEKLFSDPDYEPLRQDDIRQLVDDGSIEFSAHSNSHCNLIQVDEEQLNEEVNESKRKVELLTSRRCRTFCMPAGRYNNRCIKAIGDVDFQTIMTSDKFDFNYNPDEQPVVLGRNCVMVTHDRMPVFVDMLDGFVQRTYHKLFKIRQKIGTTHITKNIFKDMADSGKWEASYGKSGYGSYNFLTRKDSVAGLLEGDQFEKTLDLGCGTGDYVSLLYKRTSFYVGVDFVPAMAERASQKFNVNRDKVGFLAADASHLPFQSDSFDSVIAIGFIEYFDDPDTILMEISRILKKGGTIIIQSYKMDFYWLCAYLSGLLYVRKCLVFLYHKLKGSKRKLFLIDRPYKKNELDTMLAKHGFDIIDYRYDNFFLLPRFISKIFPNIYIQLSESINKKSKIFNFFAVNYVAKYRHNNKKSLRRLENVQLER